MNEHGISAPLLASAIFITLFSGCQTLPGTNEQQGAVGGAALGAILGSTIAENHVFGALLGGALGAGGGYLIGANYEKLRGGDEEDRSDAQQAVTEATNHPATAEDVNNSSTADLNGDGFVTMDEVVAMDQAGLSNEEMSNRLKATGQVFDLNAEQKNRLIQAGVSPEVVAAMGSINKDKREQLLLERNEVISHIPQG